MASKIKRQNRIKEILKSRIIGSHDELVRILNEEGIKITQATLSRDFAELGVVKTFVDDKTRYVLNSDEWGKQISKLVGFEILGLDYNNILIVIKTIAGRAAGVAHYIDRQNIPDIMGSIGGVDTVIVIPKDPQKIPVIVDTIKSMIES